MGAGELQEKDKSSCLMVGIIAPLPQEAAVFRAGGKVIRQAIQLSDKVQLIISGMGAKNAALATEILAPNVSHLISWGTAGGLIKGIEPGMLLVPNIISDEAGNELVADPVFVLDFLKRLPKEVKYNRSLLSESSKILKNRSDKIAFHKRTSAAACDMESFTIGMVAQQHKIPFNAIRFVTDDHTETLPQSVLLSMNEDGQLSILNLLNQLVRRPSEISQIWQLSRHFSYAKKTMAPTSKALMTMGN